MSVAGTSGRNGARWFDVADRAALQQFAYRRILDAARRSIEQNGRFLIVLCGGNTPRGVYQMLRTADADWSRWQVYFSDERCLPASHAQRNSRMAADAWLDHVPIPQRQIHAIAGELGAEAAARGCIEMLRGVAAFDFVLLGLGEDGHTASLFPGREWGVGTDAPDALAVFDAPKPPPQRVSLSAARLSRTREALFLAAGESKRAAVTRWCAGEPLPASAIRPEAGVDVLVAVPGRETGKTLQV